MTEFANAEPTKGFFLEMLTRDIALEDAVLDLVDNCVDSLARTRELPLSESLLDPESVAKAVEKVKRDGLPHIDIKIDKDEFSINDNCGGISYDDARDDVFRFGRVTQSERSRLSVYGIGLKRAVFKLGRDITVESKTTSSGFRVEIDTDQWAEDEDWQFPLERLTAARTKNSAGTAIVVRRLTDEVKLRLNDGQMMNRLHDFVGSAYALILDRFVAVRINDVRIKPKPIPLGGSPKVIPGRDRFNADGVTVTVIAGLAERIEGEWNIERAGWYVFCNGRVVVFADKTDLTGWGVNSAQFVSKYRGFVGLVFFFSKNPEALPWTTTKRGLNRESHAYQLAKNRMAVLARPVIAFLNNMYAGEVEEPTERVVANTLRASTLSKIIETSGRVFQAQTVPPRARASFTSIQYKVRCEDLDKAKKALRKPAWSASRVGQLTFEYFLDHECAK